MNLDKKLGVWRVDYTFREDKKIYAKDYYCVECYNKNKKVQAEVFWEPIMDSDIGLNPYCKPCKEKIRDKMIRDCLIGIMEDNSRGG